MLQRAVPWVEEAAGRVLNIGEKKDTPGTEVPDRPEMCAEIDRWWSMFQGRAEWLNGGTRSLGLPAAIAGEMARLTAAELRAEIAGGARAQALNGQLQAALGTLREKLEYAAATGGIALKPYVNGDRVVVDCVRAGRFFPTAWNGRGEITGAVFIERVQQGRAFYTRFEHHLLTDEGYLIRNLVYLAHSGEQLGTPVRLDTVDEWAELEPELVLRYADGTAPERPLFTYFRMPFANYIDGDSPLGVSVYGRAVELIREADRQYSRILREYERPELAARRGRLFRRSAADAGEGAPGRDRALIDGLNWLLRRIEFACYLPCGTLSDPGEGDGTEAACPSAKQRSDSAVHDVRRALRGALEHLVWAMDFYMTLYQLAPAGAYQAAFTFGDGAAADAGCARRESLARRPDEF